MAKTSSWLRKITVLLLAFAIVVCYSVIPMNQSYAASPKPKKISVKADTKTVDIKGKATITVTKVSPAGASTAVKFKSSKKKVAKVSKAGVVTGKKKGTVKITVTSKANKKVKKTIKIKVKDLKPSGITLDATSANLEPGKTLTLTAAAAPVGVYAPVEWTSSDPSVATVADGVVTAKAAGTATITVATTKASGKIVTATCTVTVASAAPAPAPAPSENVVETPATVDNPNIKALTTTVDMSKYEAGKVVKVWVPVPQSDEYQTITDVAFTAEKATNPRITTEAVNGNQMLYLEWGADVAPAERTATLTCTVKRYEVSRDPASIVEDPAADIPSDAKAYIDKESEYVKVKDPVVQDKAKEIVGDKTATLDKAKAIYDWCIANLERIDNGEELTGPNGVTKKFVVDGCGYGDTVQILKDLAEVGRAGGHCTDINSTFVALCRAAGIPAREMFGIRINSAEGGQHCWAEFYVAGTGWVYADPGDVLKFGVKTGKNMSYEEVQAARESADAKKYAEEYWCGVDNNRVVLSRGRDVTFEPPQAWGVCNTFGYPAAEVDGKRIETSFADYANFVYHYTSEEADKSYADMTPEEWAAVGIDYANVNYTDDFILDVRTADNYAKGHLVGSTNVSVAAGEIAEGDEVAQALDKAYSDAAGKRIVVVCNSGQTLAKRAMDYFKTHGADMSKVTYLKGGNKGIAEGEYALNNGIVSAADIDLSKDVVVDLRPADMYNAGHIVASKNIDVMTQFTDAEKAALDEQMAKVPADGKLVLVCIRGIGLAKKATAYLQSAGADMKKVTYLIGGATALAASEYKSMLGVSEVADTDVVVDVRPEAQYANGRIEGSIECTVSGSITEDQKTALKKVYEDNKDSNIVIVCIKGVGLAKSALSYLQSIGADMTKVTYLVGGFDTWKAKYPYLIGDVLVDPAAKTVEIAATVNSEYTETPEAISHLVLYNETTDKSSPFTTSVKPLDLHAALTALGAVPWSDSARSFDTGMTLNDAEGDNANFTHLDITVDGAPLSDVIKYVKDGVASDSAAAIDMAFSGNKENQTAWNTGCVSCLFSCYAGIVSNSAIGIGTVDAEHNYFYLDTAKLTGGQDVTLVYTLK